MTDQILRRKVAGSPGRKKRMQGIPMKFVEAHITGDTRKMNLPLRLPDRSNRRNGSRFVTCPRVQRTGFNYEASRPKRPQFQSAYRDFERMKEMGMIIVPDDEQSAPGGSREFSSAMRDFMLSHPPPATSDYEKVEPTRDWSREAESLLEQLTGYEKHSDSESTLWGSSPESDITLCDTMSSLSPNSTLSVDDFDIHKHLMELNPSPYPGASPTSSGQISSNSSSSGDHDADDEETRSYAASYRSKVIGTRSDSNTIAASTTLESGYISSSTDHAPRQEEGSAKRPRLSSDSDDIGSISTAPSSPHSACNWEGATLPRFRHSFPPPLPAYFTGIPAFPMPPARHFPPHMPIPLHPPAAFVSGFPGLPPPPPNVAFASAYQQACGRPLFARQPQGEAGSSQAAGGTYHKHKPWITDEILEMIAVRDRLYKRMKKHPATDIVDMYKKVRNMVVGMTRNAKRSYEKRMEEHLIERRLKNTRHAGPSWN